MENDGPKDALTVPLQRGEIALREELSRLWASLESKHTQRAYSEDWRRFCEWLDKSNIHPLAVQVGHVQNYVNYLRDERKASKATRSRALAVLRSVYGAFVRAGLCDTNPAREVKNPRTDKQPKSPWLDLAELKRLWKVVTETFATGSWEERRDALAVMCLALLGWRRSEIARMAVEDFHGTMVDHRVKRDKDRTVGIPPTLATFVKEWRSFAKISHGAIFPRTPNDSSPMTEKMLYDALQRFSRASGIERTTLTPHAMRRSYVTALDEIGVSLDEIQHAVSHESVTTTELYRKARRAAAQAPGQKLAEVLSATSDYVPDPNRPDPPVAPLNSDEWDTFFRSLGEQLFNSLPISVQVGHSHPMNTIVDYYQLNENSVSELSELAAEFLIDYMRTAKVPSSGGATLVRKWLGADLMSVMFKFNEGVLKRVCSNVIKPSQL